MPRRYASALQVPCWLLVLASAGVAQAQEDVASTRFQEGREAAKREDYAAACPKFRESFALAAKAGTLLNLADCEEKTGKLASALRAYTRLIEMLPVGDDRAPLARDRRDKLEKLVPRIAIRSDAEDVTELRFDDQPLPLTQLGTAFPVDQGGHILSVSFRKRPSLRIELVVKERERREVRIPGAEAPASASIATPTGAPVAKEPTAKKTNVIAPSSAPDGDIPTTAYVAGGVGVVGVAVSAITGVMALSKKSAMKDHCNERVECDAEGLDAARAGRTLSSVSTVAFAVGAVGLGVGGYLALTSGPKATGVSVRATPGGAALGWGGVF